MLTVETLSSDERAKKKKSQTLIDFADGGDHEVDFERIIVGIVDVSTHRNYGKSRYYSKAHFGRLRSSTPPIPRDLRGDFAART